MQRRTWWWFGFSDEQETLWRRAHILNPMIAVGLIAAGITPDDIAEQRLKKIWSRASLWLLWQLACNNNPPGEKLTSETGEMRPWRLELPGRRAHAR